MARMRFSTRAKRSFSRSTGIPTTRSGRSRKVSRATGGCLTLILSVFLCAVVIVGFIASAFAEGVSPDDHIESGDSTFYFDLDGLSFDELVALKSKIDLAIWNSQEWQEVTVPQGVWVVGEDIPEGHWCVFAVEGTCSYIQVCTDIDTNGHDPVRESIVDRKAVYSASYPAYQAGSDVESWDFNVIAGQYIVISDGDAIITPYTGKPSLGFK